MKYKKINFYFKKDIKIIKFRMYLCVVCVCVLPLYINVKRWREEEEEINFKILYRRCSFSLFLIFLRVKTKKEI